MQYPYFINPDIDALATAEGEQRAKLIRHIAACVGDEAALRAIAGIDPEEFRNFYPDMTPAEPSTEDTITSFINKFSSEKKARTPEIEEIVAAPAIDYATLLEKEEKEKGKKEEKETEKEREAAQEKNDSGLSETLFKMMVKKGNYRKALEIISELSLNNPKKSIYFAYQMRFLEKLIKNSEASASPGKKTDI